MNISFSKERIHAFTLADFLVVLAVVAVLFGGLIAWTSHARARSLRINCVWCLKEIGLSARTWADDNGKRFSMSVSDASGGTMEFTTGTNAFRHFQVMSNQLDSPIILVCPADLQRSGATNFTDINNSNLSYFVGIEASETNPTSILAGDRNLETSATVKDGRLDLTTNGLSGWTCEVHKKVGNILRGDASVLMVNASGLRQAVANTGVVTNRLQMPVLTP